MVSYKKISDNLFEITAEVKTIVEKDRLLKKKAKIDALLAELDKL